MSLRATCQTFLSAKYCAVTLFAGLIAVLIFGKLATQLWLEHLNRKNVRAHAAAVPEAFHNFIDEPTYKKSVAYTLEKSRLQQAELVYEAIVLLVALFSGALPAFFQWFQHQFGHSIWSGAGFLFATTVLLSIFDLPFDWYSQFRLEQKFGFNTTTLKLWIVDRVKGLLLGLVIGVPLLALILKLVEWTGDRWWLWAWLSVTAFQLLMFVLAPVIIMPLFNKFTPLPEGTLRERLLKLATRTGFLAKSIQVMDGSKRSRHSNAFFTGFGRFRKIVLFDTLIQQLSEVELEAVLAHEIGHYKKRHIPRMLVWSVVMMLAAFYCIYLLSKQQWFYSAFGFSAGEIVVALLLFSLLSGAVGFWFSPIAHWWSRKFEYEADHYAARVMSEGTSLITALRKSSEKNLSNLTPHPFYSGFYYSHPTLLERERALQQAD